MAGPDFSRKNTRSSRGLKHLKTPAIRITLWFWLFLALLFSEMCVADQRERAADHAERGLQSARAGDLGIAESELRKAVEMQPRNPEFLSSLGNRACNRRQTRGINQSPCHGPRDCTNRPDRASVSGGQFLGRLINILRRNIIWISS